MKQPAAEEATEPLAERVDHIGGMARPQFDAAAQHLGGGMRRATTIDGRVGRYPPKERGRYGLNALLEKAVAFEAFVPQVESQKSFATFLTHPPNERGRFGRFGR